MILYGGVDSRLDGAVELFLRREDAERVVRAWDRDEPEDAGLLQVEVVDLELSPNDRGLEVRAVDGP